MGTEQSRVAFLMALEQGATHCGVDILGAGEDVTSLRLAEVTATPQGEFRFPHIRLNLTRGYRCRFFLEKQGERVWEGLFYEQSPE